MKKIKDRTNTFLKNLVAKCPFKCEGLKKWGGQNKVLVIGILIVMVAFLSGYYLKSFFVAATVNGKPISRISVIKKLEKYQGSDILDSIITEELIRQEAKRNGIKVTEEELKEEIRKIEESVLTQGRNLDEVLAEQGMTRKDLENNLEMNKFIEKMLTEKSTVTDEEVQTYIDENSDSFPEGTDIEQVKTLVKQQLTQEKMSTQYQSWIDGLKKAAKINIVAKYN